MTAVSRLQKLQQICYFKTVSPKAVPLNGAISSAHNNVRFQREQRNSTKTARSKVCKLPFNPGSSMVQLRLFNGAMASNVTPSCRPGKYDLCRILGAIRWERRFRHTTVLEHALSHASN